jgi:hypothetical protein
VEVFQHGRLDSPLRQEIERLNALNAQMTASEDKRISLTDPDARSMATSGEGSGIVGYNVQSAVDTTLPTR